MNPFTARLSLDRLETREVPVIAIEYLFLTPNPLNTPAGYSVTAAKPNPFAAVKVDLAKAPVQSLVGWPPIKVGV